MKKLLLSLSLVVFGASFTMAQSEEQNVLIDDKSIEKLDIVNNTEYTDIQISNNVIIKTNHTIGKNEDLIVNDTKKSSQSLYIAPVSPIYIQTKTLYKEETLVVEKQ